MFKPLSLNKRQMSMLAASQRQAGSLMGKGGENYRDLSQLLDPKFALKLKNYYITTDGGLIKRKGLARIFDEAGGTDPITLLDKYTDDVYLYAFAKNLKAYRISTGVKTVIKSNFIVDVANGQRYGDYYFVASHGDKVGRVSQTLAYDAQTGNFTTGLILVGATSGASAVILEDSDSGVTGTLTLGNIKGVFQDNEIITDGSTGSATANGAVGFTYTVVTNAPIASVIRNVAAKMYVGNLSTDKTATQYSETDTGSNPPFTTWNVGTLPTDGGKLTERNLGKVNDIEPLGNNVIIFAEDGKSAWQQSTIDSSGVATKVDTLVLEKKDFGGSRASLSVQKGVFYVNESGLWQLVSVGQSNVPFSEQEGLATLLLGTEFFNDIDLSNASMAYDKQKTTLLIACAKNSTNNNLVIAYNVEQKSVSEFNWSVSRFMMDNEVIYAGSADSTKVYECFSGYDDDGVPIETEIYQELKGGDLETRQQLLGTYIQGELSASTSLTISYDIWDRNGIYMENVLSQVWNPAIGGDLNGWGEVSWGSPWGGGVDTTNMVDSFSGGRDYIRNFQRIRVRIRGFDKVPHKLNWIRLMVRKMIPIRRRDLVKQ